MCTRRSASSRLGPEIVSLRDASSKPRGKSRRCGEQNELSAAVAVNARVVCNHVVVAVEQTVNGNDDNDDSIHPHPNQSKKSFFPMP